MTLWEAPATADFTATTACERGPSNAMHHVPRVFRDRCQGQEWSAWLSHHSWGVEVP